MPLHIVSHYTVICFKTSDNVQPDHPSNVLSRISPKADKLSVTPVDLWNTGDTLGSRPGKFIVTGRATSKTTKRKCAVTNIRLQ